jgi:cysteinyl-tRNA synthetase
LEDAPEGELSDQVEEIVTQCKTTFEENMDDDFNTPGALGALYDFTREVNSLLNADETLSRGDLEAIDEVYRRMGGEALGIIPEDLEEEGLADLSDSLVEVLVEARTQLREAQEWELADKVRDRLLELGIELKDTPEGTTWRYTGS